jgi:signal transduction histidine kinase
LKPTSRNFDSGSVDVNLRAKVEAALDEHLRHVAYRNGRPAALFLVAFTCVLWPTDLLVFRSFPHVHHAVTNLRLAVVAISLATYGVLRTRLGPRHAIWFLGGGGALLMSAIGYFLGQLGGPGQLWIHLAYPGLFFSILAPLRLGGRALLVAALTFALCLGALAPFPAYWRDSLVFVMMSFVVSMAAMVVAVGHLSFRILRQSFYQSLALDHLERMREEERTRISRELHDELGQELTAMNLALALTQQRFDRDPHCIKGNLGELEALLKRTHQTTRNLVTELRPPMLDELGLVAALEWLARHTERNGVACALNAEGIDHLSTETSAVAFRIVQEALTNVVRHARARRADVTLVAKARRLAITVSDDGIGLPSGDGRQGFGLIGIRERVTTLAGRLDLKARPGGGTTLAVSLPLRAREASS